MQSVVRHGRWPWSTKSNPDEQQPVLVHDRMQFFSWQVGNMIFWLFFSILGQPMCVLLYYHDLMNRKGKTESSWPKRGRACQDQQKAWLWKCFFPCVLQEKLCWAVLYRDVFFYYYFWMSLIYTQYIYFFFDLRGVSGPAYAHRDYSPRPTGHPASPGAGKAPRGWQACT